jgi:hypothetical protein
MYLPEIDEHIVSPDKHLALGQSFAWWYANEGHMEDDDDDDPEAMKFGVQAAQAHATLALAGYMRDIRTLLEKHLG